MLDIFDVDIDAIIRKAVDLRERLATEVDDDDPQRSAPPKRRQLARAPRGDRRPPTIADGVIAAGLPLGGKPGKALDEAYDEPADRGRRRRTRARRIGDAGHAPGSTASSTAASPRPSTPTTSAGSRCTGSSKSPT